MSGPIGQWDLQAGSRRRHFRPQMSMARRLVSRRFSGGTGTVPHGFATAVVWQATTAVAIAAPAVSTGSLLPKLANVRRARSGVVKTWRLGDETQAAVIRLKPGADRGFEIHTDSRVGLLHARLPLAPAVRGGAQNEINANASASKPNDARDPCIFATGDPRDGQCVLARVAFFEIGGTRTVGHLRSAR